MSNQADAVRLGGVGERIAAVRNEVFELVAELRHGDDSGERERVRDLMQSIANQLGSAEEAILPGDGRSWPPSR